MMSRKIILNFSRNFANKVCGQKVQSPLMKSILSEYNNFLPNIIDRSLAKVTFIGTTAMTERIKKCSEYYTIGRYPVQGEFMLFTYEALNRDLKITDELLYKLQVIITAVEMVQTYFFYWDDLEDNSTTRLGKPCWHLLDNMGVVAFNDACIMRSFINEIVRQNFKGEMCANILSVFNEVYFKSSVGQHIEAELSRSRHYENYTMEHYNKTNNLKSAFYAVKSPLLVALSLSNKLNKESYDIVDNVAEDIGILVQSHNDLIDYYNTKETISGKSGTDIQEGKFSWVSTAALENCTPDQRRVFTENYGSSDPEKVERIIQLYEELNVAQLYKQEEQKRYDVFNKKVSELPKNATPSAEFFKRFQNLMRYYSQDTTSLMYDKH